MSAVTPKAEVNSERYLFRKYCAMLTPIEADQKQHEMSAALVSRA